MEKDAYYFPHFCNAKNDRKILRVRKELGVEGYGIFFMLLETLRDQADFKYPLDDVDLLADEFGTSEQKIRTVVCNYNLFDIDQEEHFFSPKLIVYLQPYFKMREQRRLAGIASGKARNSKQLEQRTTVQRELNENEQSKVKKSKVKYNKEVVKKQTFKKPSIQEIKEYCKEKGHTIDAEYFFDYYEGINWMRGKTKITRWKSVVATWASNNKKYNKPERVEKESEMMFPSLHEDIK